MTKLIPDKSKISYDPTISWDKYVNSQPDWINLLLKNTYFFTEDRKLNMVGVWNKL